MACSAAANLPAPARPLGPYKASPTSKCSALTPKVVITELYAEPESVRP
jgi:hypothetical protein